MAQEPNRRTGRINDEENSRMNEGGAVTTVNAASAMDNGQALGWQVSEL